MGGISFSQKKKTFVVFFTNQGRAIQIAVPKGKSVNATFNKGNGLHFEIKEIFLKPSTGNWSPWCQGVARQCFVTQSGHCTQISETGKGCGASAPSLFSLYARFCHLWLEAQKTPRWKKISNAQKSRFSYFSV